VERGTHRFICIYLGGKKFFGWGRRVVDMKRPCHFSWGVVFRGESLGNWKGNRGGVRKRGLESPGSFFF